VENPFLPQFVKLGIAFIVIYAMYNKLIFVTAGRLLGDQRTSLGSFALRESEATATKRLAGTEITTTLW